MSDVPGRRWALMNRMGTGTVYWLGGNTQPARSTVVNPVETIFPHLAARLTRLEAQDALDRQGKVLQLQGWEAVEIDPLEEWGE